MQVISKLKELFKDIRAVSCGSEQLHSDLVEYKGVVSNEELNELYNKSKFVLCLGGPNEGLNLLIPESLVAGTVPISLSDSAVSW